MRYWNYQEKENRVRIMILKQYRFLGRRDLELSYNLRENRVELEIPYDFINQMRATGIHRSLVLTNPTCAQYLDHSANLRFNRLLLYPPELFFVLANGLLSKKPDLLLFMGDNSEIVYWGNPHKLKIPPTFVTEEYLGVTEETAYLRSTDPEFWKSTRMSVIGAGNRLEIWKPNILKLYEESLKRKGILRRVIDFLQGWELRQYKEA